MSESSSTASSTFVPENDGREGPFAVNPTRNCPHTTDQVYIVVHDSDSATLDQPPCAHCGETKENWMCVHPECNFVGCSRYQQGHMLAHHKTDGHNICLSLSDHSVFCYSCNNYIDSPQIRDLVRQVQHGRK